jgi:hypothetical protein
MDASFKEATNYSFFLIKTEARIDITRIVNIITRDRIIGISNWKKAMSIFNPTKVSTKARPTLRYRKYPIIPAIAK